MSGNIQLFIQCELRRDTADWILKYLHGLASDPRVQPSPQIPHDYAWLADWGDGQLPGGDWFEGPFAEVQIHDHQPHSWEFRLHGSFHESAVSWQYAFLKLLACWSSDGILACSWTDLGSTASVWHAHDGELFNGSGSGRPRAVSDESMLLPLPTHRYKSPDARQLRAYGLDDDRADRLAESGNDDPALARWLLARRLWRAAVEEADYESIGPDASARQIAALAVEHVLRALDGGRDPEALPGAPGWRVIETSGGGWSDMWPRPIGSLAGHLGDLRADAARARPILLEPGMQLRTITDLSMTARSSELTPAPSGGSSWHQLQVLVPADSTLTIAKVWELGHASATSPEWVEWITDEQRGLAADESRQPRSDVETYTLHIIQPLDLNEHWIVSGPANS